MENKEMIKEVAGLKLNGCASVKELKESCRIIPDCKGVYFILREPTEGIPEIKPNGPVREHKGKILDYPVDLLKSKWVDNTNIIYIGKTDSSLKKRINTYINFGKGKNAPHRGGRAIWQLKDSDDLVVGWKIISPTESARDLENELIVNFRKQHEGKLPFANFVE